MLALITILNRCHRFPGFVYREARFSSDHKSIEIAVRPRKGAVRGIQVDFPTSPVSMGVARIQPPGVSPYDIVTPIPHEIIFKEGVASEAVV